MEMYYGLSIKDVRKRGGGLSSADILRTRRVIGINFEKILLLKQNKGLSCFRLN